jgi:site-specific DNA recombinase
MRVNDLELFQSFGLGKAKKTDTANVRCILYTRVSSKAQEDGMSLEVQARTCRQFAERNGYEIVAEFGNRGESAKAGSVRKDFEEMLAFARKKANHIRYIVFYDYSRFSREGGSAIVIKEELKAKHGITIKSATMPINNEEVYGSGMEDQQLIWAKQENDIRRKRCTDGTKARLRQGHWCGSAPLGYKWVNKVLHLDPAKAPLIEKAFQWKYDDPATTSEEIRKRLKARGLDVPRNTMSRMLHNPLYCGLLAHNLLEGEVVQGRHQPIISHEVFLTVNGILKSNNNHGYTVSGENDALPLKLFMVCEHCGEPLTGYLAKKKNGKERNHPIPYYKCRGRECACNINANRLAEKFLVELKRFQIREEFIPLITQELEATLLELNADKIKEADTMEKRLKEIDAKLARMKERYIVDEEISRADYEEFSGRLKAERQAVVVELAQTRQNSSNPPRAIAECIQICRNLTVLWEKGDYRAKQRVQQIAFPEGMAYSKKTDTVRTPRVNALIGLSSELSHILGQKETGQITRESVLSRCVPTEGVEPTRPCEHYDLNVARLPIPPHGLLRGANIGRDLNSAQA